jgi:hypothetical protein
MQFRIPKIEHDLMGGWDVKLDNDYLDFFVYDLQESILPNFFLFPIFALSLAITKCRKYFLMLQTLKLLTKNGKNLCFTKKKVW